MEIISSTTVSSGYGLVKIGIEDTTCGRRKGAEGVKSPLPPSYPWYNLVCRLSLWLDEYLLYSVIVKLYDVYSRSKFGQLLSVCFKDLHVLAVSFHDSNTVGASEGA